MTISKSTSYIAKINIQKSIKKYLKHHSSPRRLSHSLQVAKLAKKLCVHYNVDPYKGAIAGLGHDIARELNPAMIKYFADKDERSVSEMEISNPLLLHGRAGAIILQNEIGISDEEILTAVRDHVLGKPGMTILSKIIFIADFLEPKRDFLSHESRKGLLMLPLDKMLLQVIIMIFSFLQKNNYPIAEQSIHMYNHLKEILNLSEKI